MEPQRLRLGAAEARALVAALAGRNLSLPTRDDRRLAHSLRLAASPTLGPLRGIAGHGLGQGHAETQVADGNAHVALHVFEFDAQGARPALITQAGIALMQHDLGSAALIWRRGFGAEDMRL